MIYQHQTVDSLNGDKSRGIIHSNFRRPLYTLKDKMLSNYVDGFLLCTHNIARQSCKVFDMNKNKLGVATSKLSHKTIKRRAVGQAYFSSAYCNFTLLFVNVAVASNFDNKIEDSTFTNNRLTNLYYFCSHNLMITKIVFESSF